MWVVGSKIELLKNKACVSTQSVTAYSSETSFDSGTALSDGCPTPLQPQQPHNPASTTSVFVAQTDDHFCVYDSVPWTVKDWSAPKDRIQLIRARVLSPSSSDYYTSSASAAASASATAPKISMRYGSDSGRAFFQHLTSITPLYPFLAS